MPKNLCIQSRDVIAVLLAVASLAGCAATGDDYVVGVRPALVEHPVFGSLTIKEQDLLGPDADLNGVRDEIDKTLRQMFADSEALGRGEAYALQVTKAMLSGATGRTPTVADLEAYANARGCLSAVRVDAPDLVYAQTTRTPSRADAMRTWAETVDSPGSTDSLTCAPEVVPSM